jgi:hypothetical protein
MGEVIDHPSRRSPMPATPAEDHERSWRFTAHYLAKELLTAAAIAKACGVQAVDPGVAAQCERVVALGEPVRRYHNGQPITPPKGSAA